MPVTVMMPAASVASDADDLAVLQDIEHGTLDGVVRIVQLQQLDLDLGIIFKNQIHIAFAVPVELLADFVRDRCWWCSQWAG